MNRSMFKLFVLFALPLLTPFAVAGPGSAVTTLSVVPQNVPKLIAAFDAFMASPVGKTWKGRTLLLRRVSDGTDPATVGFVALYRSLAENEAFGNAIEANPAAWNQFLDAAVPLGTVVLTARTEALKSWGDVNDTDTVWENFYFNVSDYPAFVAAIDAWNATPPGKKFPGQGHLIAIVDAGAAPGTPQVAISVGYASMAEMEAFWDPLQNDPDWQKYLAASAKASTFLGSDLERTIKSWGPATMQSVSGPK
jgi:hypothetical protein